jgi:Tfp pilus assembly protein PilF
VKRLVSLATGLLVFGCASAPSSVRPSEEGRRESIAVGADSLAARAEVVARQFGARRGEVELFAAAIALADSALQRDAMLPRAHLARAIAFAAAGRPQDASDAYRRLLALDPDYPGAASAAVAQFWRAGHYDEAYRWGQLQVARDSTNLGLLFNLNVACAFLIEVGCAESLMLRALVVDPRFATAHGELAFLAQYAGRKTDAVQHMEAAVSLDPGNSQQVAGLAQMLIPSGDASRARSLLEGIDAANSSATAYGGRSVLAIYGWALRETGDTAAARGAFARAMARLEQRERNGETTYQLFREMAAVAALMEDRPLAIASLRKAVDAGLHTYASWDLSDPMLASIRDDPEVEGLVERMRADTRRMREAAGLP